MAKSKLVKKVWGSEEWLANTEKYCGKILNLKEGYMCSYHHHKIKDETFYVLEGRIYLKVEGIDQILETGESQRILPGQRHCFSSLTHESRIIEISTHHEDSDSYRETESCEVDVNELRKRLGLS